MNTLLKQSGKTIAIHTWEPGIESIDGLTASSGGASWLRYLIDNLLSRGNTIIWVTNNEKAVVPGCEVMSSADLARKYYKIVDTLFMPWRWEIPGYEERNTLYGEQFILASKLSGRLVIHDEDHMMLPTDKRIMQNFGAILTTPALYPPNGFEQLHFPYPFVDDPLTKKTIGQCDAEIAYVGNNYGRFNQTCEFLNIPRDVYEVQFWGNWLSYSADRESPEVVEQALPHAVFNGRLPNDQVRSVLRKSFATVHLCKKSYAETGFITMRWAEAASVGTIGFVPAMFKLPRKWYNEFNKLGLIVRGNEDIIKNMHQFVLSPDKYRDAIESQRSFIHQVMRLDDWKILL